MSKCDCFEKLKKDLSDRVVEKLPIGASLEVAEWDNMGLFMRGDTMVANYYANFKVRYRKRKKDGDMASGLTKSDVPVVYSYCPFCGVKVSDK
ncbi:hypothetical protein CPT_Saba_008 [Proteus phage Saba]|uniref:Uncharacterized protein n=1 Tax=Proteus phage Saba TaxID=2596672 RepID=A0A5B9ND35_9CAUD|nr:hypothetical protein JT320_gp08 [Proteus phage Saba]QEG09381.1 hypothetical protein CPT_Saba_008 [Proteus phage Saba]